MKKFLNYVMYSSLLIIALSFIACQEEFEEPFAEESQEAITANSVAAELLERTVSHDGSFDNIIDGSSCFGISFPYTVNVNGLDITIDSKEDLQLVEEIFDALEDDTDILNIIFPITITLADFTEVTINDVEDLREIAKDCIEGGDDDDIECIDFVYPIKFFTFDSNNERTGEIIVNSDKEFRRFFAELGENGLVSIDYPVTLKKSDGTEVVVNSNAELVATIEAAKETCDEDDDDDFNDDDFSEERFDFCLTECSWIVTEVKRDGTDQTGQYDQYLMTFSEDGSVNVKDREGNNLEGTWSSSVTDEGAKLTLEFDTLVDFSLEWMVYEIGDHRIKLFSGDGNRIIMKQNCVDDDDNNPDTLREVLKECSWIIKKVKLSGEEVDRLLGYEFQFMPEGIVTLSNGETTSEGTWEITENAQGRLVMAIVMGNEQDVSFEWKLSDLRNDRLKFEVEDFELVLLRECDDNNADNDIPEIRNFLSGGDWIVAMYSDMGTDETQNYGGYSLSFSPENRVVVSEGTDAIFSGLWRLLRDDDEGLKLYLNLENGGDFNLFDEFTDDWKIVSVTQDRIELKDINDDDGSITTLVFEKQ